jgi:hypothetical protein
MTTPKPPKASKPDTPALNILQTVFMVMIVVPNVLPQGQAIDPAHARNAAVFRLVQTLIGVVGLIGVGLYRWLGPKPPPPPVPPSTGAGYESGGAPSPTVVAPLPPGAAPAPHMTGTVNPWAASASAPAASDRPHLTVVYRSLPESTWRCERYVLFHYLPTTLGLFFMPALCLLAVLLDPKGFGGILGGLGVVLLVTVGWFAFFLGILWLGIKARFPKADTVRMVNASLTAEGMHSITPEKTTFTPWRSVTGEREHEGDVYIFVGMLSSYTPRQAFRDRDDALRFCEAVRVLRKSKGKEWASVLPTAAPANTPAHTAPEFDLG